VRCGCGWRRLGRESRVYRARQGWSQGHMHFSRGSNSFCCWRVAGLVGSRAAEVARFANGPSHRNSDGDVETPRDDASFPSLSWWLGPAQSFRFSCRTRQRVFRCGCEDERPAGSRAAAKSVELWRKVWHSWPSCPHLRWPLVSLPFQPSRHCCWSRFLAMRRADVIFANWKANSRGLLSRIRCFSFSGLPRPYPRVVQTQNHITVVDQPVANCDPVVPSGKFRSIMEMRTAQTH
jgi:hypothetical protein